MATITETTLQQTRSPLEEAQALFGIQSQDELHELVWRFRGILSMLQSWDSNEQSATLTQETGEEIDR